MDVIARFGKRWFHVFMHNFVCNSVTIKFDLVRVLLSYAIEEGLKYNVVHGDRHVKFVYATVGSMILLAVDGYR